MTQAPDLEGKLRTIFGGRKKYLWAAGAVFLTGVVVGSCNRSIKFQGTYNGDPIAFSKVESFSKGDKVKIDSAEVEGETTKGIVDIVQIKTTRQGKQYVAEVGSRNDTKKEITIPADGVYQINLLPGGDIQTPNFYGKELPIDSGTKVVYFFDNSICRCDSYFSNQVELFRKSIRSLPEDSKFGIVVFNVEADCWQSSMIKATPGNKSSAIQYIESVQLVYPDAINNPNAALARASETFGKYDLAVMLIHQERPQNELAQNPDLGMSFLDGAKVHAFVTKPDMVSWHKEASEDAWDYATKLAQRTGGTATKIGFAHD